MQSSLSQNANRAQLRRALLAFAVATIFPMVPIFANDRSGDGGPVVQTAEGPIQGYTDNGVSIFKGIPYAAPPVGELRWRPPVSVKRWRSTLDATQYKSNCPQVTELGAFAGPSSVSEDCLYLSVFTSNKKSGKKPVIVWIHGGGDVDGESDDYDGSKLATGGPYGKDTVVVVINYRLGLFGFLSHAAFNSEGHLWGNYGILDIQAALRWVQRNASAFGGDPTKVTLGGQSAGSQNTGANLLSPLATGLFHRAIIQSGPQVQVSLPTAAAALTLGTNFATAAGCTGSGVAKCLRGLPAARILQLQGTPNANGPYLTGAPIVDGTIVPIQPLTAWQSGQFNKMPILAGSAKDESAFLIGITEYFSGPPQVAITAEQYPAKVAQGVPSPLGAPFPAGIADQYPLSNYGGDAMVAYNRASADRGKCTTLHVLKLWGPQVPTYGYDFTYQNAPYYFPKMPGFKPMAAHTIDIQFLFQNFHGGPLGVNLDQETGQPRDLQGLEIGLSDQLVAAWTNFAATGNPNASGNSPWPKIAGSSVQLLNQSIPLTTESETAYRTAYKCDFWDPVLGYTP